MNESEKIYYSIFKAPIPPVLLKRFDDASKVLCAGYTKEETEEYDRVLERISDLEALELVARRVNKITLLVKKFQLMVYLAETVPECRDYFVNRVDTNFAAWFYFFLSGWRMVVKFFKGLFLLLVCRK